MRERLIELSKKAQSEWLEKTYDHETEQKLEEYVSDYLLKMGVIHIPCKVGDIVYQTDEVRIYEVKILDIFLQKNKPYYKTDGIDFDDDAIGKSIFLTRQEAEARNLKGLISSYGLQNNR